MTGRTARRLALMRHERWLVRHHPESVAPPCLIREHNRQAWKQALRALDDPEWRAWAYELLAPPDLGVG